MDSSELFLQTNIEGCLEEYTREHSYEYEDYFDLDVYSELRRRKNILFWSLSDKYNFGFEGKPLCQIVSEDLIGE